MKFFSDHSFTTKDELSIFFFFSVLVFSRFPAKSDEEENRQWRHIKGKINSKCRATKFSNSMKQIKKEET